MQREKESTHLFFSLCQCPMWTVPSPTSPLGEHQCLLSNDRTVPGVWTLEHASEAVCGARSPEYLLVGQRTLMCTCHIVEEHLE